MVRNYEADFVNRIVKFKPYKNRYGFLVDVILNIWILITMYFFIFFYFVYIPTKKLDIVVQTIARYIGGSVFVFLGIFSVIVTIMYFNNPKKSYLVKWNVWLEEFYCILFFPFWRIKKFNLKNRKRLEIKLGIIYRYKFKFYGATKDIKKIKYLYKRFMYTKLIVTFNKKVTGHIELKYRGWKSL